jgi:poly-gamma-glutamate system protein
LNRYKAPIRSKIHWKKLLPFLLLLLAAAGVLNGTRNIKKLPYYDRQIHAARRMEKAFSIIHSMTQDLDILPDPGIDPNRTGFIGVEFNEMTTTVGSLESKRTSTNPDFSALIISLLRELKLEPGTRIVLTLSGSFPALNLASVIACEELELEPLIISSAGASSFGANRPEMTWFDIETILRQRGIISHTTALASLGGENDLGESYFEGGLNIALAAIERNGLIPLVMENSEKQQKARMESILAFHPEALINVGGNQLSVRSAGHLISPGIIKNCSIDNTQLGLIGWFLEKNLPVIHLLKIKNLALRYGLPVDPVPLPSPGESPVYHESHINGSWAAVFGILICIYLLYLFFDNDLSSPKRIRDNFK